MLDTLITSKTRVKLLQRFFTNGRSETYLRSLEQEFGESSNGIRVELNRLEESGFLISRMKGNKKIYFSNQNHPLFADIQNIVRKHIGIDSIIDNVLSKFGDLEEVYLVGDLANGIDSEKVELLLVGNQFNVRYLEQLFSKVEKIIKRSITFMIFDHSEFMNYTTKLSNLDSVLIYKA